jgi:hypothetical protein
MAAADAPRRLLFDSYDAADFAGEPTATRP